MFRKPFKIKSNSQIKGSDRKNVKEKLLKSFPNLTEADIENLLPKKEVVTLLKLVTSSNEIVHVYTIQKCPIAFDIRGVVFPTVYLLWKFPNMLPSFTTHSQVISFLTSGADLMLPGVITPPNKYGNLPEGAPAYVNVSDNQAAVAVGVTAQTSFDMLRSGGKGKCLTVYHIYGDKLCSVEGTINIQMENLGPPDWLKFDNFDESFPELGAVKNTSPPVEKQTVEELQNDSNLQEIEEVESVETSTEAMDTLLNYCFLVAIKYSKTLTFPILTSNFFKLQMIPVCPEGKTLDIKKTSFKKLKPFLDSMDKDGIISVKEIKKGVESIISINRDHPKYTEFYIEPSLRPKREEDKTTNCASITESFIISPNVLPLFAEAGFNKGDVIQLQQIRKQVVEYVKRYECQNEENKRLVKPKEALIKICKTENYVTWEELMEKVCESMKPCYKIVSANTELVNKGKVSPITLTVSQRSGNKKVTLVDNLELFGIHIADFAKECQHGVAASTSISRPLGKKCDQLLVQGNQVLFVHNLLTDKYKIPAKYIRGLENAPKKKKK